MSVLKIPGDYGKYINNNYKKALEKLESSANGPERAKRPRGEDSVEISGKSKDILLVRSAMNRNIPGRDKRIEQIKAAIKEGSYDVSSKDVADAILSKIIGRDDR